MNILIAPNAFKHSLSAAAAAAAIESGLLDSKLECTCECFPIGDGGNGTCELIIERYSGAVFPVQVKDPVGRTITASYGIIDAGRTAVIEMADASGLHLLKPSELNPMHTTSYGTGQLIKEALGQGVNKIIIGMGGSATVDGGTGILSALGVRFLDAEGHLITDLPNGLSTLARIDDANLDNRLLNCELVILCDVDNPLFGTKGAAAVFGPQKGATPEMVAELDAILTQYAGIILKEKGVNLAEMASGGVAGGASAGLHAMLGARLVNGIDYFLDLTRFGDSLKKSDLVITGEGSIDEQTLQGKGPFGVARRAKELGIPVVGLAGKVPLVDREALLGQYFDALFSIGQEPASLENAFKTTKQNLFRISLQIGNLMNQLRQIKG